MKGLFRTAVVVALALAASPAARGAELWLHVRVTEAGAHPTTVKINVPYTLVERVAPVVDSEKVDDGRIAWNGERVEIGELRAMWRALRSGSTQISTDGAVWTLEGTGAGEMLVAKEHGTSPGAELRMPARLVDALLSGTDRLDFEAAAGVIAKLGTGELLAVDEDGTRVRIWVDSTPEAE